MSRRVCSSNCSRRSRAATLASRSASSAVRRARPTISSACARASLRRSRYSARSSSASWRVRSAVSIESSIAFWRLSRLARIGGNANLASRNIETPNTSSVQIISPPEGVIRNLPDDDAASTCELTGTRTPLGDDERREQAGDEAVEEARLREREAEPLQLGDLRLHLGLAHGRLDRLAEDDADADTGAHGAEPSADTQADRLARAGDAGAEQERQSVQQGDSFLMGLGDRAAE